MNDWGYLIVWEFRVRAATETAFEQAYGPNGAWAKFFSRGEGYVGTELSRDLRTARRYVTLDFWISKQAYESFREQNLAEYKAIDRQCEELTESEIEIGAFQRVK